MSKATPTNIQRHVDADQHCILTFDRPGSSANIFDVPALEELRSHLQWIRDQKELRGLILHSAKKSIFIAGADLQSFSRADEDELRSIIALGHDVFDTLAELTIPTIACIHGACAGGGYEISLACKARIASDDRSTKIGLPETKIGILPSWGGATRLPRLIGLPKALSIILPGKLVAAAKAKKLGMVDEVVPKEHLLSYAKSLIERGLPRRKKPARYLHLPPVLKLIHRRALADTLKKTRGHYPAIPKALEVCVEGLRLSEKESLQLERTAVAELFQTPACHNLIRIFFLQDRAKKLVYPPAAKLKDLAPIEKIAVIGAGVMGAGIAQWSSARGHGVILRDINDQGVAAGMSSIQRLYDEAVKRRTFTRTEAQRRFDRIQPSSRPVSLAQCDLVIEAAVEKMEIKKNIFAALEKESGENTILASNTSALSISEIATATQRPEKVVGIHFFNPVHRMPLVEIVVGKLTSAEVIQRSVDHVKALGKFPVVVADSPGFLVNRILMPYLIEAGNLLGRGISPEKIDRAMLDFGMPMGPARLIDEVGIDVAMHVSEHIGEVFSERLTVPRALAHLADRKDFGRKAGRGIYSYNAKGKPQGLNPHLAIPSDDRDTTTTGELRERMAALMVAEAARCLEEQIVADPADVDFAMIMGTGFAPFRGGPLRHADAVGIEKIISTLEERYDAGEKAFASVDLLDEMAKKGKSFYKD